VTSQPEAPLLRKRAGRYIYIYTYRYIHIPYMGQDPGPAPLRGATHMFTHLCGPPQRPRARVRAHVRYMYVSMRMHRYMYSYMYAFRSMFRSISISISILDRFHFYEAHQRSTFYHVIHIYSRCNWKHTHTHRNAMTFEHSTDMMCR
jgi:hypothetical protein